MLTLSITDAGDGTGGTATVAGTGGGDVSLYAAPFDGSMGGLAFTLVGTRTGDGTIAVASPSTLGLGWYVWRADSLLTGTTSVAGAYAALTDGTTAVAVFKRILDAVALRIKSIGLAGLDSANVRIKWFARAMPRQALPTVTVAVGDGETWPVVLSGQDDVGLPVTVTMVWPTGDDEAEGVATVLLWRERIARALEWQRLDGVPEVNKCEPEKPSIFDATAFAKSKDAVSVLGFRFTVRWTRGLV